MDFASLMKSAISKDKSKTTPKSKTAPSTTNTSTSRPSSSTNPSSTADPTATSNTPANARYIRRSELEAQREAAYRAEQEAAAAAKREKDLKRRREEDEEASRAAAREAKKRKLAEESRLRREEEAAREEGARRKRLGLPPLPDKAKSKDGNEDGSGGAGADADDGGGDLTEEEVRVRLRGLGEPVVLFGEGHEARVRRYRGLLAVKKRAKMSDGPIPTVLELLPESECQVPAKPPPRGLKEERTYLFRQLASYFTMVLTEWERALAGRAAEVKEAYQGKQATMAFVSSRENMRPLFRRFESGDVDDKVLEGILEIVNAAQRRRYVDASDAYLTLSIGKAAWPIGVTMVGIHARSAREKLHEHDQKAHIMSDESTRKYLQAIKQCLSFAQTRWPPDDHLQLMG